MFRPQWAIIRRWYIECTHSMGSHIVYIINHIKTLSSVIKTNQLMLYRENFAVFYLKYIQILCGQNVGFFNVKTRGTYINR
jgi:hypothetical protein